MKVKNTMGCGRQNKNRVTQNESFNKNSKKSEETLRKPENKN